MDQADAGQGDGDPVEPAGREGKLVHVACPTYASAREVTTSHAAKILRAATAGHRRAGMASALPATALDHDSAARPLAIARWLLAVAGLVFVIVVVGGITRLTESGLSITEWKPVSGAIPPLDAADWNHAFALYQATPEYREINGPAGMGLAEFKQIYFWEWLHRLLGRLIGLAFALPLAWFAVKRAIPQGYGWKLAGLLMLGGLQGA